jgi:voltage-gated potassium channel
MYKATKKLVHGLLHPEIVGDKKWDKIINVFIITLIILNVIAVMLETVKSLHDRYAVFFAAFDYVSVLIFTVEYVLRVWSSNHEERYKHSIWGRLKYMASPGAIIDLLAIIPTYLHIMFTVNLLKNVDLRILRMLRLLRLFRLFRLTAYTKSAHMIMNIFKKRSSELLLSLVLATFLIIFASCVMYFAEHMHPAPGAKISLFTSIPKTIWWSVVTLTTTGYGDMYPVTNLGKALASIIMLSGVAFFALPAGIITAGFIDEFRMERVRKTRKCPHCGEELDFDDNHANHG